MSVPSHRAVPPEPWVSLAHAPGVPAGDCPGRGGHHAQELAGALAEAHGVRLALWSLHRALARAGYLYLKG
jgi:hypothetical protein